LCGSDVLAKDMLFATLDPTTRRLQLPDGQPLLLTDTVGFVRNLPHRLIEAFKSTLEEAVLADFLIHVLDASSPCVHALAETTRKVLGELGAAAKPTLTVLNKIDLVEDPATVAGLHASFENSVAVSLTSGEGMGDLIHAINDMLLDRVGRIELRIPQARADLVHLLHLEGKILSETYEGNDILISAVIPHPVRHRYETYVS
jgi:GTP-binding protein HflX